MAAAIVPHQAELWGWGMHPRAHCRVAQPTAVRDVFGCVRDGGIARGLGRSYGDPALTEAGVVVDMTALDAFADFDADSGRLRCQAGTSLHQIITTFAPRGWFPPITPGTKFVTVGGCIANDVHGKAHRSAGCFSNCVRSMTVLCADGTVVEASRERNADLFWGCFGGMGLLGIVLSATLQLSRIETTYFRQRAIVVRDLAELLEAFEDTAEHPYSVAWIDSLATGARLGRGVLTVGDHASLQSLPAKLRRNPLRVTPPPRLNVPFDLPGWALNGFSIRLLNGVIGRVQAHGGALAHYENFFFPLDFVGAWNRGYGKRGLAQYQFVIPLHEGLQRMRQLLETIVTSGQAPFLNVLKKFGPENPNTQLSFPFEGYTFAIDFPIRDGLAALLRRLDAMVLDAGGRVYLGKDAFLDAETFGRMYPRLPAWRAIKQARDPGGVFASQQSRRVGLTR